VHGNMEYPQESHTWIIKDKATIKRLHKAIPSDAVDSIIFEMHGMKWFLRLRPNGLSHRQHLGNVFLILYCTGLPPHRSSINFRYKLCLTETNTIYKQSATFKADYMNISWDLGVLKTSQITKLKQFSLSVTIELLAIYDGKGVDVLHEYQHNDEYDQINEEHEHNLLVQQSQNKRLNALRMNLRARHSPTLKPNARSKARSKSPIASASASNLQRYSSYNNYGSYDVVAYQTRLSKLEKEMKKLNLVIGDLANSVKSIEATLTNEYKEDIFDVQNDQYALVMMEVNTMKRTMAQLLENRRAESEKVRGANLQKKLLKQWFEEKVKYPQYYEVFVQNDFIDLDIVARISKVELKEMKIVKVAHQMRIMEEIGKLSSSTCRGHSYEVSEESKSRSKQPVMEEPKQRVHEQQDAERIRMDTLNDTDVIKGIVLSAHHSEEHAAAAMVSDIDDDHEHDSDSDELYESLHPLHEEGDLNEETVRTPQ